MLADALLDRVEGAEIALVTPRADGEEWRRALALLRSAPAAAGMGTGRAVLPADVDLLVGLLPSLAGLSRQERERIITQGRVMEVQPGTRLTRAGEKSDAAYFVLSGKAVAGISSGENDYHSLSSMSAGDFFGEIAALTGAARTADVVAEEATQLLEVPPAVLRVMMAQPAFSQMLLARMSERLARTTIRDLPRFAGLDQETARELREGGTTGEEAEPVPA